MNVIDFSVIIFLLLQFFISGCIFHYFFIKKLERKNIVLLPRLVIYGIFFNITILQIWHLFLPINIYAVFFIHLIQISFLLSYHISYDYFRILKLVSSRTWFYFFIFILWISVLTNSPLSPYDAGLYHLPIINWNNEYRIVKGLANLSIDYGINSNLFLLIALAKNYPFYMNALWAFNGTFLGLGFFSFLCIPLEYLRNKNQSLRKAIIFRLLFIIPLIHYTFYYYPGTSTDLPLFVICSIIAIEFYYLLDNPSSSSNNLIPILVFLGISIKVSFLMFGFSVLCIYFYKQELEYKIITKFSFKMPFYIFVLSAIIWTTRSVILSGYPLLPITSISLPVSWKMDKKDASIMAKDIVYFSMPYNKNESFEEKLIKKIKIIKVKLLTQHRRIEIFYPLIFGTIGLVYALIFKRDKNFIILIPFLIQLLLWIYIPKNRYSSFAVWWFCSFYLYDILNSLFQKSRIGYFPIIIILLSIGFHRIDMLGQEKTFFPKKIEKIIPSVDLKPFQTTSGLNIFTPDKAYNQCWDSNLLCTPYPNENLVLFDDKDIGDGFYVRKRKIK